MMRRARPLTLLATSLLVLCACTSTQPATTGNAEVRVNRLSGDTTSLASVTLDRAHQGAIDALNDLQFSLEKNAKDAIKGVLTARTADGSIVNVTLTRKADMITQINVNSGSFNQGLSQTVMSQIQERLR